MVPGFESQQIDVQEQGSLCNRNTEEKEEEIESEREAEELDI